MEQKLNSTTNGAGGNRIEIPEAKDAMDSIKYRIAKEIGVNIPTKKTAKGIAYDWRMVPSYYCGAVGGEMVKRMMQFAEKMAAEGHDVIVKESGEGFASHENASPEVTPYEGPTGPVADTTH